MNKILRLICMQSSMNAKIYCCEGCKRGFYYKDEGAKPDKCPHCAQTLAIEPEGWEEFRCTKCDYQLDVSTIKMHGNLKRISPGELRCKYDNEIMHWVE